MRRNATARQLWSVGVAMVLVMALATASTAASGRLAEPAPPPTAHTFIAAEVPEAQRELQAPLGQQRETPAQRRPTASMNYLISRYRVTPAEAERRLRLQQQSPDLAARLAQRFPQEYAGMWLDQSAGGVLKVATTAPATLAGSVDPAQADLVPAKWSLLLLKRRQSGFRRRWRPVRRRCMSISGPTRSWSAPAAG